VTNRSDASKTSSCFAQAVTLAASVRCRRMQGRPESYLYSDWAAPPPLLRSDGGSRTVWVVSLALLHHLRSCPAVDALEDACKGVRQAW
jgi:hypothetical protein